MLLSMSMEGKICVGSKNEGPRIAQTEELILSGQKPAARPDLMGLRTNRYQTALTEDACTRRSPRPPESP